MSIIIVTFRLSYHPATSTGGISEVVRCLRLMLLFLDGVQSSEARAEHPGEALAWTTLRHSLSPSKVVIDEAPNAGLTD